MAETTVAFEHLQLFMEEHFDPGQRLVMIAGIPRAVTAEELGTVQRHLREKGLPDAVVQYGATPEWPHAIRVLFTRPPRRGPGQSRVVVPLLLAGGLSAVSIEDLAGARLTSAASSNLIPLLLIGVSAAVLIAFINWPRVAARS